MKFDGGTVGIKRRRAEQNQIVERSSNGLDDSDGASLHALPSSRPRIEKREGQVLAVFPRVIVRGKPYALNINAFYLVPAIADLLAEGLFLIVGPKPNPNTVESKRDDISNGIVRFLRESQLQHITPSNLDSSLIAAFIAWLNSEDKKAKVARFSIATRARFYNTLRNLVRALRENNRQEHDIPEELNFRRNVWSDFSKHAKHKTVHNDDLMTRVRVICMSEVEHVITRVRELRRIIEFFKGAEFELANVAREDIKHQELPRALYLLSLELRDGLLPTKPNIPDKLARILAAHGLTSSQLSYLFHPTARTLVPFVILLTMAASYNADVARNFRLDDYRYSPLISNFIALYADAAHDTDTEDATEGASEEIELNAFKGRSRRRQRVYLPVDDAIDNPSVIIDFVVEWTKAIRENTPAAISRHLFIYTTPRADFRVSSFSGIDTLTSAATWRYELKQFRNDHELEHFTLDEIRGTILNITRDVFDGDIKKTAIQANHRDTQTTSSTYTSIAEKNRQYQRLGQVHEKRVRYVETNGRIDSRDFPIEIDTNCATPGWSCIDAYDSPYSPKGKLCTGYGLCPNCRLGAVDLTSPLSYAYSLNLVDAINRAQTSVTAAAWFKRFAPVKKKLLERWLPAFTTDAVNAARELHLPPMVPPE